MQKRRIAIYSRKSKFTGKGDSIENQIEMCKQYIEKSSIKNEQNDYIIYEDEGFSGGTTNRPQFKKMILDIRSNKIDILVCYKLDRISRNVSDFSSMLELLEAYKVNFISISEQFDTTTPMGRAMIYIASVFAQLERETIAERVRDNMLELAKNGRWTGGKVPMGFISKKKKYVDNSGMTRQYTTLEINKSEMDFIRDLYKKYLELGSLHKLEVYATEHNLKSKQGIVFEKSTLKIILRNTIYVKSDGDVIDYLKSCGWKIYGEPDGMHSLLTYNKTEQIIKNGKTTKTLKDKKERFAAVSTIMGAIDSELWLAVQKQFDNNKDKFPRLGKTHNALLIGKIRCGYCKSYMLIQHGHISKITGEKLFYYICSLKRKSHRTLCKNKNAKANEIERLVIMSLKNIARDKEKLIKRIEKKYDAESNNGINEKKSLNISLVETKRQIDNLLNVLSKNPDIADTIADKIRTLKKEQLKIENELTHLNEKSSKNKINKLNLNLIKDALNKCEIIDKLTREEQKQLINSLVDTIYWYGNESSGPKMHIKFIGSDNSSDDIRYDFKMDNFSLLKTQFSKHCTTSVTKNATFKNIFKDADIPKSEIYGDLPENTIGQKIYKIRTINGLTRRKFADACSIGYSSVCKYETNIVKPCIKNLKKISEKFKLPLEYFHN